MKLIILLFFTSFSPVTFSQNLIIQVDETQPFFGDSSQTIVEILNGTFFDNYLPTNCRYFINTTLNYLDFYKNDTLQATYPIKTSKNQSFIEIDIIKPPFNVGLILNLEPLNQMCLYFNIQQSYVIYYKFTKYEIVKTQ